MYLINPNTSFDEFLFAEPELRRLFDNLGIDCRGGENKSLAKICQEHHLDSSTVARLLTALQAIYPPRQVVSLELMTLTELCDHLEQLQQITLREELARLDRLTRMAAQQQGAEYPQFVRIHETFVAFREQFTAHLREEAEGVFPLIRQLTNGESGALPVRSSLKLRLAEMEKDHNQADESLAELFTLASDESLGRSAAATMRAISTVIIRLKHTVHEQIYKENRVLFPRALAIGGHA
jgi:regulator of cell morphogenesis and NO signaling